MKAMNWKDQLRKGNIIKTEYGIREIVWIAFGEFYVKGTGDRQLHCKVVEPVKTTQDVLFAFGAMKVKNPNNTGSFIFHISNEIMLHRGCGKTTPTLFIGGYRFEVKHAHQLQNIFWDLTGKQLEYKPIN